MERERCHVQVYLDNGRPHGEPEKGHFYTLYKYWWHLRFIVQISKIFYLYIQTFIDRHSIQHQVKIVVSQILTAFIHFIIVQNLKDYLYSKMCIYDIM